MSNQVGARSAPIEQTALFPLSNNEPPPPDAQSHGRLFFEVQRKSAAYHLGTYLSLRRGIWSDILKEVADSDEDAIARNLEPLTSSVWQYIANRDQLQSDLTILLEMIRKALRKGKEKLAWTTVGSFVMALVVAASEDYWFGDHDHIINAIFGSALGICGAMSVYYGVGIGLLVSKKLVVKALQNLIEEDQVRESDRGALDGWSWLILQFTSL
ncbi:hypothetical protein CC86DRAFT_372279, partial [Ophiobolus disseminans]